MQEWEKREVWTARQRWNWKERHDFLCCIIAIQKFSNRSTHTYACTHTPMCTLTPDHLYALDRDRHWFNALTASCSTGRCVNFVMEGKRMSFPSLKEFQSCPLGPSFAMDNPPNSCSFPQAMLGTALKATKPGKRHKPQWEEFFGKWGVTQASSTKTLRPKNKNLNMKY